MIRCDAIASPAVTNAAAEASCDGLLNQIETTPISRIAAVSRRIA
jgi:hypothetical protein